MIQYDNIISSFLCVVPLIEDPLESIEVDLCIVSYNDKYGLIYKEDMICRELGKSINREQMVLPCVNENIFCDGIRYIGNLIIVNNGKQGLTSLQAAACQGGFTVIAKELLPCIYDQITNCLDTLSIMLLYQGGKVLYYDVDSNEISVPYDEVQSIHFGILGCWEENKQKIVNLYSDVELYQPELGWKYDFLCRYDNGCVFKVAKNGRTVDDLSARLVFYSDCHQKVCYTKIYDQISVFALDDGCGCLKATEIHLISNDEMEIISATNVFISSSNIDRFIKKETREQWCKLILKGRQYEK